MRVENSPEPQVMTMIGERWKIVDDTTGSRLFEKNQTKSYLFH